MRLFRTRADVVDSSRRAFEKPVRQSKPFQGSMYSSLSRPYIACKGRTGSRPRLAAAELQLSTASNAILAGQILKLREISSQARGGFPQSKVQGLGGIVGRKGKKISLPLSGDAHLQMYPGK